MSASHYDAHGLALSTASSLAAEHYREGLALMLSTWSGADVLFGAALAEDPAFALAHAALARLDAFAARPAAARARIATACDHAAANASEREQSHIEALSLTITSGPKQALAHALAHAERWPRDVLILGLPLGAFGLFAFSGMADHDSARVDLCSRHAAQFDADDWWFLTYHGWALAEHGEIVRGRDMLERAFALRRANANAVHGLTHALYESGAQQDADAILADWLPGYGRKTLLHGHLSWHAALIALERGDAEQASALYLGDIAPEVSYGAPINIVTDGASLLWRMAAQGHVIDPALWQGLAAYAHDRFPKVGHGFTDAHLGLIAAATGDAAAVEQRAEDIMALVAAHAYLPGPVVAAICRAALAFAQGDYRGCAAVLLPVMPDLPRIGGSGAQRDVIGDMTLIALMRSGEIDAARSLLDARLHRRAPIVAASLALTGGASPW
jgi:hypothetical protein